MPDDERLSEFEQEFKNYRRQKSRNVGGVGRRVLQNLAMYIGEQWVWFERGALRNKVPDRDESGKITEVNLVFNLIQETQEKIYGRLTASTPEFQAFPDNKDPEKIAKAEVVTMSIPEGDHVVRVCLDSADLKEGRTCPFRQHRFVMNTNVTIRAKHQKFMRSESFHFDIE